MTKPTFQSLWLQLEPMVNRACRVKARAILALAWGYGESDEPAPADGRSTPKTADVTAPYIPTPEEIRAACQEIQDGWSASEARHRAGKLAEDEPYTIPIMVKPTRQPAHRSDAS